MASNMGATPPDDETYRRGETADAELKQFVARREKARKSNGEPRSVQALWQASKERYDVAKKYEARMAWAEYHRGQANRLKANLGRLVSYHEQQAALYDDGAA